PLFLVPVSISSGQLKIPQRGIFLNRTNWRSITVFVMPSRCKSGCTCCSPLPSLCFLSESKAIRQKPGLNSGTEIFMNISIRPFTPAELEATDAVIIAAYNIQHSRKESLLRYLALQPGGSFVAQHNGTVEIGRA